jgi:hypothetical protein
VRDSGGPHRSTAVSESLCVPKTKRFQDQIALDVFDGRANEQQFGPVPLGYMRIISTRLMPRVCGIHRQKPKALGLKFGCGFTWHLSIKVLRLRECCGVPWRAFFFAVMGCSGLARTGIGPI